MATQRADLVDALKGAVDSWQEFLSELRAVSEDDFTADPGDGEWSVKRQVEHSIGSEIYFASLIEHALTSSGRRSERDRLLQLLDRVRQETLRRVLGLSEEELDRPHITDDTLQTSLPGVYAAGDVRRGSTKQLGSAIGEGITALLMVRQHLQKLGEKSSSEVMCV